MFKSRGAIEKDVIKVIKRVIKVWGGRVLGSSFRVQFKMPNPLAWEKISY